MAKRPVGRPPIEIDWDEFEKLCQIHCTLSEVAGWFKCSEDTIENKVKEKFGRNFSDVLKEFSATGKASLRRQQYAQALQGNTTMLIWLGKQHLGQVDSLEHRLKREEEAAKELTDDELFARAKLITQDKNEDQG